MSQFAPQASRTGMKPLPLAPKWRARNLSRGPNATSLGREQHYDLGGGGDCRSRGDSVTSTPMTPQTLVRDVEDFSASPLEVLARHHLATLGDVLRWVPDGSVHQFVIDNIAAIFADLGYSWHKSDGDARGSSCALPSDSGTIVRENR